MGNDLGPTSDSEAQQQSVGLSGWRGLGFV